MPCAEESNQDKVANLRDWATLLRQRGREKNKVSFTRSLSSVLIPCTPHSSALFISDCLAQGLWEYALLFLLGRNSENDNCQPEDEGELEHVSCFLWLLVFYVLIN